MSDQASATRVEAVAAANRAEAEAYLARHEDSAQFLINNLREQGPALTAHPHSGNFKAVRQDGRIVAMFCLSRQGNLIVQSDGDFSALILQACAMEPIALRGFIGEWNSVAPIYRRFKVANPGYRPSFESRDILFARPLRNDDAALVHDPRVRLLVEADFGQWLTLRRGYEAELGLPADMTDEQHREQFPDAIRTRRWWGLFEGATLRSQAALNSCGATIGQVGGVFTPPAHRQQHFARATMLHLLKDCRELHGHTRSILFTGGMNHSARRLYESIGYRRIGSFALILG